jgi:hypothetical protein
MKCSPMRRYREWLKQSWLLDVKSVIRYLSMIVASMKSRPQLEIAVTGNPHVTAVKRELPGITMAKCGRRDKITMGELSAVCCH